MLEHPRPRVRAAHDLREALALRADVVKPAVAHVELRLVQRRREQRHVEHRECGLRLEELEQHPLRERGEHLAIARCGQEEAAQRSHGRPQRAEGAAGHHPALRFNSLVNPALWVCRAGGTSSDNCSTRLGIIAFLRGTVDGVQVVFFLRSSRPILAGTGVFWAPPLYSGPHLPVHSQHWQSNSLARVCLSLSSCSCGPPPSESL